MRAKRGGPRTMRGGRGVAVAVAVAVGVAGCSGGSEEGATADDAVAAANRGQSAPFERTVTISGKRYRPARTRILVGGSITWINLDEEHSHTAESTHADNPDWPWAEKTAFDTHTLTWGEPYTVTFHKPGTYEYVCSYHGMRGVVDVVLRIKPSQRRELRRDARDRR